jgi:hypothetical protein
MCNASPRDAALHHKEETMKIQTAIKAGVLPDPLKLCKFHCSLDEGGAPCYKNCELVWGKGK